MYGNSFEINLFTVYHEFDLLLEFRYCFENVARKIYGMGIKWLLIMLQNKCYATHHNRMHRF